MSHSVKGSECINNFGEYRIYSINAAALIKFSAFLMRRLFKGDVYFEITFLESLTAVTGNRL